MGWRACRRAPSFFLASLRPRKERTRPHESLQNERSSELSLILAQFVLSYPARLPMATRFEEREQNDMESCLL